MAKVIVVIVLLLAAAVGGAAFVHPEGLDGALRAVGIGDGASDDRSDPLDSMSADERAASESSADTSLADADAAFDAGRYKDALRLYRIASGLSRDTTKENRATRGAQEAAIAIALLRSPTGAADADLLEKRATQSDKEEDWLGAARAAAAAGRTAKLPRLVGRALQSAVAGGRVEQRLVHSIDSMDALDVALVAAAMRRRGLSTRDDGALAAGGGTELRHPDRVDDEPSGISGTGDRGAGRTRTHATRPVFIGGFDSETRARLNRAADLIVTGLNEYARAGAEGSDRKQHRRVAYKSLVEARGILDEAATAHPSSRSVSSELQRVQRAIAQLRKEMTPDEMR